MGNESAADQEKNSGHQGNKGDLPHKKEPPKELSSETEYSIRVGGARLRYKATAGNYILKDEEGKPRASIFYVAYTQIEANPQHRPITFAFNGGPGSSSVWLHLGGLGPKRVELGEEGDPPPPPYRVESNPDTLLEVSDLIFIDPVTTGFSRALPPADAKKFHGVEEDLESIGEFIRLWTTRNQRWASPKFLAGASYGTTRSAGLAELLQQKHGMFLNGLVLISPALDFKTVFFHPGNDLIYALFLPTYTAVAWYHGRLEPGLQDDLEAAVTMAEEFALGQYLHVLILGHDTPEELWQDTLHELSRFTGLPQSLLESCNLRIDMPRFGKELLKTEDLLVGRLDARFTGSARDAEGRDIDYDPSYASIQGPFTGALNHYLRTQLKVENDLPYEILTMSVRPWDFGEDSQASLNVAPRLYRAMCQNPALKLFVALGYFDLATPPLCTKYTLNHLGPSKSVLQRVTTNLYRAGHMSYSRRPTWKRMKQELKNFYAAAAPYVEPKEKNWPITD